MLRTAGRVRGLAGCGLLNSSIGCGDSWGFRGRVTPQTEDRKRTEKRFLPTLVVRKVCPPSSHVESHVDVRREKSYEFFFPIRFFASNNPNFSPRELSSFRSPAANKFWAGKRFLPLRTMLLSVKLSLEFFA